MDSKPQPQNELLTGSIKKMAEIVPQVNESLDALRVIYPGMKNRDVLNSFRDIRTKLLQITGDANFVLMVTSACSEGGASFFSVNLGAAIALDRGKSALVVDCNLHNPTLQGVIPNETDLGLVQYLEDSKISIEEVVYATGINRLRIVPLGKGSEPALELFTSERMRRFINEVKSRYPDRYIILDVPPITESADARIIQELCDFCVLIAPYGKVSETQVLSSIDAILKEKFVGLIMNDF